MMMKQHKIQVLGTGCSKCTKLAEAATKAAEELGLSYELEKVTDVMKFADFGVMVTPALVVDGSVLTAGKVPSHEQLLGMMPKNESER
jgi:small redox-active disulfide protein 2